jgi:hypothetical protein
MESNHPKKSFADPCLSTWLPRHSFNRQKLVKALISAPSLSSKVSLGSLLKPQPRTLGVLSNGHESFALAHVVRF